MRTIKFRAWTELVNAETGEPHMAMIDHDGLLNWSVEDLLDPENGRNILMQFTGLLDKNGKEIYEGDVIKEKHCTSYVIFEEGRFQLHQNSGNYVVQNTQYYEIIGNIYENPELLTTHSL